MSIHLVLAGLAIGLGLATGQGCTSGFVSDDTFSSAFELRSSNSTPLVVNNNANKMNVYPTMSFNCSGVITGVRAALPSRNDRPLGAIQDIFIAIALLRGSAVVDVIVLRSENTTQTPFTVVRSTNVPLNVPVQPGDYIGLSIPRDNVSGQGVYYIGVAAAGSGRISGRQYVLTYSSLTDFDARIRRVNLSNGDRDLFLSQPYLQFTVEPSTASPQPTSSPFTSSQPSQSTTPPQPPMSTDINADNLGLLVGSIGGVIIVVLAVAVTTVVLVVLCGAKRCTLARKDTTKEDTHDHDYDYAHPEANTNSLIPLQSNPAYDHAHPQYVRSHQTGDSDIKPQLDNHFPSGSSKLDKDDYSITLQSSPAYASSPLTNNTTTSTTNTDYVHCDYI